MRRLQSGFERFYSIVVLVKGFDGVVELVLGAALLLTPQGVQQVLAAVIAELSEGTSALSTLLAAAAGRSAAGLAAGVGPVAAFLLVHGIVKLATVYCLLRRLLRFYPWAIAVLAVLLLVQLVDAVLHGGLLPWVLVGLDVLVLALVGWEYHRLRREHHAAAATASGVTG